MAKKPKVRKYKREKKTPVKQSAKVKTPGPGGDGDHDADDGVGGVQDDPTHPD